MPYNTSEPATELLLFLNIYPYGLHQGIMGYIAGMSNATVQRIFYGWVTFLATLFNEIYLKPPSGYWKIITKIFVEIGNGLTI